ncbi:MAG TPA: alanine racemase [Symbiobacteriaceae bacterium]
MEWVEARPTRVLVDLDAIAYNVKQLRSLVRDAEIMAVVKADGYGHGAVPVARTALEAGATWLGVATVEEGMALRQAGITAPILVLGYVPPVQAGALVAAEIRPALWNMELARALSAKASAAGRRAPVHVKVDTGMGRVGVPPEEAVELVRQLSALPGIQVEGIFTHLAVADEPEHPFTARQLAAFQGVLDSLREAGFSIPLPHACNSAGMMLHPEAHYKLVRVGIALYGLPPNPEVTWPVHLRPALSWRTEVSMVKELPPGSPISYGCTYLTRGREKIATLPVGYADGYSRLLSNKGEVLIHGRRCPVVGRVCMDQMMVRVPADLSVQPGDEVILIGEQEGERVTATDLARLIGTINYEVVCGISKRVPRWYRKGDLLLETEPACGTAL